MADSKLSGVIVANTICPDNTGNTYATHDAKYGKDGWRSVSDFTERNSITPERRKTGMAVYVNSDKNIYILKNEALEKTLLDDTDWEILQGGSTITGNYLSAINPTGSGTLTILKIQNGFSCKAFGTCSHAEGNQTIVSGEYSHTEGSHTFIPDKIYIPGGAYIPIKNAHAEGSETSACGSNSHAEGIGTIAYNTDHAYHAQHVEGAYNIADVDNKYQHIVGGGTQNEVRRNIQTLDWDGNEWNNGSITASAFYLHDGTEIKPGSGMSGTYLSAKNPSGTGTLIIDSIREGRLTSIAYSNIVGHAEGYKTSVYDNYSHAEGCQTAAKYRYSHAEGSFTITSGTAAHAEGCSTSAIADYSHTEGLVTYTIGKYSHAEGCSTSAQGIGSFAEGQATIASGDSSHTEGYGTVTMGKASHAEGYTTFASGNYSHAEGQTTFALGNYSHAEGYNTKITGQCSHAEGSGTSALNDYAHAEGFQTIVTADGSHAEGRETITSGRYSHAEGQATIAYGEASHVEGKYNIADMNQKYQHIVGGGTTNTARKNIQTLDWTGNLWTAGDVSGIVNNTPVSFTSLLAHITTLEARLAALENK